MKNINWIKIAGIIAVVGLVIMSLFAFTAFARKLPDIRINLLANFIITLFVTISTIFYISKTNYGTQDADETSENETPSK